MPLQTNKIICRCPELNTRATILMPTFPRLPRTVWWPEGATVLLPTKTTVPPRSMWIKVDWQEPIRRSKMSQAPWILGNSPAKMRDTRQNHTFRMCNFIRRVEVRVSTAPVNSMMNLTERLNRSYSISTSTITILISVFAHTATVEGISVRCTSSNLISMLHQSTEETMTAKNPLVPCLSDQNQAKWVMDHTSIWNLCTERILYRRVLNWRDHTQKIYWESVVLQPTLPHTALDSQATMVQTNTYIVS